MSAVRAVVRTVGELFITLGTVLLLFVAWQLWWTDLESGREQTQIAGDLRETWERAPRTSGGTAGPAAPAVRQVPLGDAFALVRIPRFGSDYVRPVLEGVEMSVLNRSIGHYPDSVDPGAVGNFSVAGHRVTYGKPFNRIAELRSGDAVVVETQTTWFVYRVQRHVIVTPDRVDVVAPVPERPGATPTRRMMTMTACHPQFSARERYVVFSELDQTIPKRGDAVPPAVAEALAAPRKG